MLHLWRNARLLVVQLFCGRAYTTLNHTENIPGPKGRLLENTDNSIPDPHGVNQTINSRLIRGITIILRSTSRMHQISTRDAGSGTSSGHQDCIICRLIHFVLGFRNLIRTSVGFLNLFKWVIWFEVGESNESSDILLKNDSSCRFNCFMIHFNKQITLHYIS